MTVKQIFFTSRQLAESVQGREDMAVISITDPGMPEAFLDPAFQHVLRLSFLDAVGGDDFIPAPGLFTPAMARSIASFVDTLQADARDFSVLVHCECGASRSAAVALFVESRTRAPLSAKEFTHKANPWVIALFEQLFPETDVDIPPVSAAFERRSVTRN